MARRADDEQGFTLLEMIVVIAVVAAVLSLVITRGPMHSRELDLDAAVQRVAGALRLARSRSIAEERAVSVVFAMDGFRTEQGSTVALPGDISLAGDRVIRFTPDGGSSGGRIILQSGTRHVAIGVDWLTGRVVMR